MKGHGSILLAEGAAAIQALKECDDDRELMIYTDSKNIVQHIDNSLLADFAPDLDRHPETKMLGTLISLL